jgi:hypothetical protein
VLLPDRTPAADAFAEFVAPAGDVVDGPGILDPEKASDGRYAVPDLVRTSRFTI